MTETHHAGGFHGPKCWIVSALAGALLGLLLTLVMPAQNSGAGGGRAGAGAPQHATGEGAGHGLAVVVETRPDGTQHVRHPDETTTPLSMPYRADDAASVEALRATASGVVGSGGQGGPPSGTHAGAPHIPLVLCIPFALLLLSIAVMPFINEGFWHRHYPDFAFLLGALVLTYYLAAFGGWGGHEMLHAGIEYYSFIALVGGLYVASGGILIDIRTRGRALSNAGLLALGAVLSNIVGTTGASVLLIRPFMRMNHGRLRPLHVVFFIFIVSNCGGCLTPIGDPPLYLGYLKGVPFAWTLTHLWPMWLLTNGLLLAMFFAYDLRVPPDPGAPESDPDASARYEHRTIIAGWPALGFLGLLVAGVFIDPAISRLTPSSGLVGLPVGATFQILVAAAAHFTARPSIHHSNQFTFAPVKEVGFLFVGIFLTMAPALGYLRANASGFGLESPSQFYFGTGALSAFLDNAPTYLSFTQVALGVLHLPMSPAGFAQFIANTFDVAHLSPPGGSVAAGPHFNGQLLLEAVSLGAVFFGALTYIGNGPNFMVKSIVETAHRRGQATRIPGDDLGVRMPSFITYALLAACLLLPVLVVNWAVFIR